GLLGVNPATIDEHLEWVEQLGALLTHSPLLNCVQRCLGESEGVKDIQQLAASVFGGAESDAATNAMGRTLQMITAGRIKGQPLLSLRAHLFAREHKQAFLCLNPAHSNTSQCDAWWRNLSFVHRERCGCGSQMYPIVLCRKCGFV